MFFLKSLVTIIPFLLFSCAKIQYVYDQGLGQMSILNRGIDNRVVLEDPQFSNVHKEKIRKIEEYKKYFFDYFQKPAGEIYSKTTFLQTKPVSHMVVASPYDKVQALEECFWFVGCFPYLSFFDEKKAKEYAKDKRNDGFITYERPVYAYSTLNYFTDTILSSFFYYDDEQLAELIFHELFHTLFFIKGDVDMSENLAQYFGMELQFEFFKVFGEKKEQRIKKEVAFSKLRRRVLEKIESLNMLYENKKPQNVKEAEDLMEIFLKEDFYPQLGSDCEALGLSKQDCFPVKTKWNNASLAAYMTYEKNIEQIRTLHINKKMNLLDFYNFLVSEYEKFKKQDSIETFSQFLFDNN